MSIHRTIFSPEFHNLHAWFTTTNQLLACFQPSLSHQLANVNHHLTNINHQPTANLPSISHHEQSSTIISHHHPVITQAFSPQPISDLKVPQVPHRVGGLHQVLIIRLRGVISSMEGQRGAFGRGAQARGLAIEASCSTGAAAVSCGAKSNGV